MNTPNEKQAVNTAVDYVKQVQSALMPALLEQQYKVNDSFSQKTGSQEGNPSFGFDVISNNILFEVLSRNKLDCYVFSEEEHSWKIVGSSPKYYVICDPFCNSSLATHTFRDSAVAICISDLDGQFITCTIGDLQIRKFYFADVSGAYVVENYHQNDETISKIKVSTTTRIEDAFVVTPLLKPERRKAVKHLQFYDQAKMLHGVDGAIMIARLAAGYIDGYLDPLRGQPLYEVPCCELIVKAGGIVTDAEGRPFRINDIITGLLKNTSERYRLVAAGTQELHDALLHGLNTNYSGKVES
jgi:fructose-1,6-bisphosphatase/inositol monophosphatase family enzyme